MAELTDQQKRFAEEYIIDLNGMRAAIRAGYSVKSAGQQATRLLKKAKVQEYIEELQAKRARRTGITQDRVLLELARIAFVNAGNVIDDDTGKLKAETAEDDLAAISQIKVKSIGEMTEREVKLADKVKALELLGKHLGMFQNNVNVNVETSDKLADIMAQIGGEGLEE